MDWRFASDISSPSQRHRYRAFAYHRRIRNGKDTYNRTYFSCSFREKKILMKAYLKPKCNLLQCVVKLDCSMRSHT
jgi:hypothetical protein